MKDSGLPHPRPLPYEGRGVPAGVLSLLGCFPVGTRASRPRMSDCCYSAGGTPAYHCAVIPQAGRLRTIARGCRIAVIPQAGRLRTIARG